MKSFELESLAMFLTMFLIVASCIDGSGQNADALVGETRTGNVFSVDYESGIRPDRRPLTEGQKSPDGLKIIMSTSDLGVGGNRIGFVLFSDSEGFLNVPIARVTATKIDDNDMSNNFLQSKVANYQPWLYGRGSYVTWLEFEEPGVWLLDVSVKVETGITKQAHVSLSVEENPAAPSLGDRAIMSVNKTLADVDSLEELSTGSLLDEDLYRMTIAEAVVSGKPTVIVFASPGFCTNAVCGPQVEVLGKLKDAYSNQANFIHVDFYENPHQIQGNLENSIISLSVLEWRLPSIEWTFVIDQDGIIHARLEGFSNFSELEGILRELL